MFVKYAQLEWTNENIQLLEKINNPNKQLINKLELVEKIKEYRPEILLTIGAGDIGEEVQHIKRELNVAC